MNKYFGLSGLLFILALAFAYPVYMEGVAAQKNANLALEAFEEVALETKTDKIQLLPEMTGFFLEPTEAQTIKEEKLELITDRQQPIKPVDKQEVSYTPIAKLQVEKIGLEVSVLSEWSYALLDISVNKFSGPEPNEPGNFVVIGHNYKNGAHFGSLYLLEVGDLMNLTDLLGRKVTYEVYEILVIKPDDVAQLATYQDRTLTLITCDTNNEWRVVVKSKASHS
jgi:LPXTG-site transpeptidase (sortase) family protein